MVSVAEFLLDYPTHLYHERKLVHYWMNFQMFDMGGAHYSSMIIQMLTTQTTHLFCFLAARCPVAVLEEMLLLQRCFDYFVQIYLHCACLPTGQLSPFYSFPACVHVQSPWPPCTQSTRPIWTLCSRWCSKMGLQETFPPHTPRLVI